MPTSLTAEQTVLEFDQEITIEAPPEKVFEGLLHRLSDGHMGPPDTPIPLVLERRPGGRWYRDLGNDSGHLWGHVQSIKAPSLIELFGPMFMSYPVSGHVISRLTTHDGGTTLSFKYTAFGLIDENHRAGLKQGWTGMLNALRSELES